MQCLAVACDGLFTKARSWGGIVGAGVVGLVQYFTGNEIVFAPTITGAIAHTLMWMGAAWLVIFCYKLFRAPGIVTRRNMPLQISLGPEATFYEIVENENIIDQTVSAELKNISDVSVRHCKLQITNIRPFVGRPEPIFITSFRSIESGKAERIPIAYFKKAKLTTTRRFGICVPPAPVIGGNILTIPEGVAYDITIEASCDEAEENQINNCRLWIDEIDILRLAER
jgi:hypothetical protein